MGERFSHTSGALRRCGVPSTLEHDGRRAAAAQRTHLSPTSSAMIDTLWVVGGGVFWCTGHKGTGRIGTPPYCTTSTLASRPTNAVPRSWKASPAAGERAGLCTPFGCSPFGALPSLSLVTVLGWVTAGEDGSGRDLG